MDNQKKLSKIVLGIALPLALQSLLGYMVNLLDTVMIGRMGTGELSAVSQANQIFFIVSMAIPGIADGANVLISQAWGNHDTERIHKVLAYAYRTAVGFIIILTTIVALFPETVMSIYTNDPLVIELGARYLRIVVWSYMLYALSGMTTGVLRSVRIVKIAMYSSLVSLVLKSAMNWLLIGGKLGFPALGIEGAALATLIARTGEFLLVMVFVYWKEDKLQIRLKKMRKLEGGLGRLYFRTSIPVICNEVFWAFGVSAQAIVLGRMGTDVVAANSICSAITQLTAVLFHGISSAACVIVGNAIGSGEREQLDELKKYFQKYTTVFGTIAGSLVLLAIPLVPFLYHIDGITLTYCRQLMLITAIITPFQAVQSTNMMGVLRGGGDVHFQMLNDMIFLWGVTVPLGFLTGMYLQAPIMVVGICLKCDQVIKVFTSEWRLRTGKWVHDMTGN